MTKVQKEKQALMILLKMNLEKATKKQLADMLRILSKRK